ncbi:LuxR C-terminal-related transcriptional regulator [Aquabacterium sp.]|uniref:LuxR C-terminal-related transcriptional regulator n=1 Tax=Aquabacterium sp. TaxID=1872578 RepID=UPI0025B91234|nr:LuxR C-terminal-related transcriptional regulator [Aquabacterium sp.]
MDVPCLTQRQIQVCELISQGLGNHDIAAELGLSAATIKAHRGEAMRRLQAGSVADLVRAYLQRSGPGTMASLLSRAKPIQVRVCEPDEQVGPTLAHALNKFGHVVRWHASPETLLQGLASGQDRPDVLILSLYPGVPPHDFDLLENVRQHSRAGLFVLLPQFRVAHRIEARQRGADGVFDKPVVFRELHGALQNLVDRLPRD